MKGYTVERIASKRGWVHPQIKEVAVQIANELYELCASKGGAESNEWYANNKNREAYIERTWPLAIPRARATLAQMLASPIYNEEMKSKIHQALVDDQIFREGRMRGLQRRIGRMLGS